jgi:hypothetical protein
MMIQLIERNIPIDFGVCHTKFEVVIGHLDLKIGLSDIVNNLQATVLAI